MEVNIKIAKPTAEEIEIYKELESGPLNEYCTLEFRRLTKENDFDQVLGHVAKAREMFKKALEGS